jgi:hypothetical protein
MQTVITVLLVIFGVFAGLVLAVMVLFWYFKRKISKAIKGMGMGLMSVADQPVRLTLKPASSHHAPTAGSPFVEKCDAVRGLGFESAGLHAMEENPGALIHGFVHEANGCYAAVCSIPGVGAWIDVVTRYTDGRIVTHTDVKATGLDRPEFATTVNMKDAEPGEIVKRHLSERPQGPRHPAMKEMFKTDFEAEYARSMDWRMARGVSQEEVKRVAELSGEPVTAEALSTATMMSQSTLEDKLDELIRNQYLRGSGVSAADWEEVRDRIIVIRANSSLLSMTETVSALFEDDDAPEAKKAAEMAAAHPPREAFERIIREIVPEKGYRKLGSVDGPPMGADLWVGPEERVTEE